MWKKVNKGTGEAVETEETGETREAGVFGGESLHKGDQEGLRRQGTQDKLGIKGVLESQREKEEWRD